MAQTHGPTNPKYFLFCHETVMRKSWDSLLLYSSCRPCRHVCSCLFLEMMSHLLNGWPHDHGPTNVGAMVKMYIFKFMKYIGSLPWTNPPQAPCKQKVLLQAIICHKYCSTFLADKFFFCI